MSTTLFRRDWSSTDENGHPTGPQARQRTKPVAEHSRMFIPAGWPTDVLPPSEPEWEHSAIGFLLDCCPADYRAYPLLRRQPVVLARFAAQFVESQLRATRDGIAQARSSLGDYVDAPVLDDSVEVLQREEARLVRLRRSVMLVEESLRGKVFIARL
ncbi:hypothetical protein ACQB6R_07605 [Propionibacteriaceae bacterium G1746]|uniref:hypothetical protein n=1 Tax=Aestuariimicrobium sp. G57 TaxID=3418485 RepID=UPI003C1E24A7